MMRAGDIAARIGRKRAVEIAGRLALSVRDALSDTRVSRDGATVTITGRGVLSRLRWPGGLVR